MEDDDLFGPPAQDQDDFFGGEESPFGKTGGLFSSGGGLFDDEPQVNHKHLWCQMQQQTKSYQENDMCWKLMYEQFIVAKYKCTLQRIFVSVFSIQQGDPFSDEPPVIKKPAAKQQKSAPQKSALFDDDGEESEESEEVIPHKKAPASTTKSGKKVPPGGVSIFGG